MPYTIAIDARISRTTTGRYIDQLIEHLQEVDQSNNYIILLPPNQMDSWNFRNPRFSKLAVPYDNYSIGEQTGFLKFLHGLKVDLVHFAMPQQPVLYLKPHVTTVHDLTLLRTYNSDKNWFVFHFKQFIGRFVFWIIGRTSRHIIVPTEYVKEDYRAFSGISADKITVTYEGAEPELFTPEPYGPLIGKRYLLFVGNQSDYKNVRRLMQAHQQLLPKYPDLLLVCVGKLTGKNGASLQRNKSWADKKGYGNIIYTDFVPDEQLLWLYQHCATYTFPSLMEGFGLSGLEAMASGAPVASSNSSCLPEVYGDAAHYFDPRDVAGIARAIDEILSDEDLRRTLVERGRNQVKKYSWRRMAEQTLRIYNKVLNP